MTNSIIRNLQKLKLLKSPGETRKLIRSYGTDIGYLAITWNRLHENLAKVFALVVKSPSHKLAEAVWYSTDSDANQRKMLRAATQNANHLTVDQRKSILWILNRIDETLRHDRNNALHAPVVAVHKLVGKISWVQADENSESPRAKALRGKDLKREFRSYSELASRLSKYTRGIIQSLTSPERFPWPDKPPLPHASQKTSPKGSSRRNIGKQS